MRILILGAGATGRTLAVTLSEMDHDLVLVDSDAEALAAVERSADVMTIQGQGSSPVTLEEAGIGKTDLLLAVTNRDEVNILACLYAHAAGVRTKVARIADTDYLAASRWDWSALGLDLLVSQSQECADEIRMILRHPGAVDVVDILEGKILAVGLRVLAESPLAGKTLLEVGQAHAIVTRSRVMALLRRGKLQIPHGNTRLLAGDEVYVALRAADVDPFLDWALPERPSRGRVIVAGGGGIGLALAAALEQEGQGRNVVLIEQDARRSELAASTLHRTLVLRGDASHRETLEEAGLNAGAAFVALTGDDELNIVSCVLAKEMGAAWTVAQVGNPEYAPIIRHMKLLDRVTSPYTTMINVILRFVRGRNVRAATLFQSLPGEILEVELGVASKWAGRALRQVPLPPGAIIPLVQRAREEFIPGGDFVLAAGDRLAVFVEPEIATRVAALLKK
ncbi:MAG: Trk system potassium transporter TrkA [Candidatus Marinimicrobia bacterium]|nr:Trk system potassium transporter TrkA [Candidatus Neomarinimicrobiota bacterium]